MQTVVGIRFKKAGKIYYFHPGELPIAVGDNCIVETSRGVEYGEVVVPPKEVPEDEVVQPLKQVIRVATDEDRACCPAGQEGERSLCRCTGENCRPRTTHETCRCRVYFR